MKNLWLRCHHPLISQLVKSVLDGPPEDLVQFLLDASVHYEVFAFGQNLGDEAYFPPHGALASKENGQKDLEDGHDDPLKILQKCWIRSH